MMQKKVQIISDGSLDLSQELTKEKDIEVVPFYVSFDSETYQKEMVEVGVREFYQEMVDHPTVFPKTSMPSVHDYYEVFEKHAKEQLPVICLYHQKIQWLPAVCDNCKRYDIRGIPGCTDHGH